MAKADKRTLSNFLCLHFDRMIGDATNSDVGAGRAKAAKKSE